MPTFADRLRALREKAGLTQAQVADAAGLPVGSLRNYEQGIREPLWGVLFRLAAALGVECGAFADCEGTGKPPPPKKPRGKAKGK